MITFSYGIQRDIHRDNYSLQLLRLLELPDVSPHLLIFLKLLNSKCLGGQERERRNWVQTVV